MLELVPVSVIMAAAALEANANEVMLAILDKPLSVTPEDRNAIQRLFDSKTDNTLAKYDGLTGIYGNVPTKGAAVWQAADLLMKFRNSLVHFRPEWDDGGRGSNLYKKLRTRLRPVRFFPSPSPSPYAFMTHESAAWSVQTVLDFSAEFSVLLGLEDRFARYAGQFTTT